jgi:hypothetical protein
MPLDRPQPDSTDVNQLEKMLRRAGFPEITPDLAPKLRAITVATVAILRTIDGDVSGNRGPACCLLNATATPGDGGVGIFYWNPTLQGANGAAFDDNGVTYVQVMGGNGQFKSPGAWVRAQLTKAPDVQEFTASGTWTKPSGATWVRVELVPWGASGGSGRRGTVGGDFGRAGAASGVTAWEFPASILGATEAVTFGSQPLGGAAQTADNTNGRDGTDAPDATFGAWLRARGGKKGGGGGTATAVATGGYGNAGTGGGAGATGTGRAGGGGGDGGDAGGAGAVGGNGGPDRATTLTGGPGGAAGTTGTAGANGAVGEVGGGGGGGGGGGQSGGTVGAGANGGRYGAGGGGGGASNNGTNSGKGGDGGPCFGRVTSWFT